MAEPGFGRIAILGLGLMGGSIAAGLKQRADNIHITAWDESGAALASGLQRGLIDEAAETAASAIAGAQLVVLAVPVRANAVVLKGISLTGQVLTDVGSVKQHVIDAAREAWGDVPTAFIPGHPIAGSERHGVTAADPDLFVQHRVILTPLPESDDDALVLVKQLWGLLGADVVTMSAEHHDAVLAQTSHLPHLLAYALVDTLSSGGDSLEVFEYAAGGFRDFSRIAASDPVMWRDIFLTNPGPVLDILGRFQADLESLRTLIEAGDAVALEEVFERAKVARDHFADILQARQR
jgi:3-phosphoshikimate 1-carboxyvinyltransferase